MICLFCLALATQPEQLCQDHWHMYLRFLQPSGSASGVYWQCFQRRGYVISDSVVYKEKGRDNQK